MSMSIGDSQRPIYQRRQSKTHQLKLISIMIIMMIMMVEMTISVTKRQKARDFENL